MDRADEHPNARVVRELYEARARGDLAAAAQLLDADVAWHEPYEFLGDLHGRDAVTAALREAIAATAGSFRIDLHDVVANDRHAVALVHWSAVRDGQDMEGREIGVYHVRDGRVVEVWFTANDPESVSDFFS